MNQFDIRHTKMKLKRERKQLIKRGKLTSNKLKMINQVLDPETDQLNINIDNMINDSDSDSDAHLYNNINGLDNRLSFESIINFNPVTNYSDEEEQTKEQQSYSEYTYYSDEELDQKVQPDNHSNVQPDNNSNQSDDEYELSSYSESGDDYLNEYNRNGIRTLEHDEVEDVYSNKVKTKRTIILIEPEEGKNYSVNRIPYGHSNYMIGADNDDHLRVFRNKQEDDRFNQEYAKLFEQAWQFTQGIKRPGQFISKKLNK